VPLRATDYDHDVLAFALSEDEWNELKLSYHDRALLMPCCEAKAIPKTSKLGLQFFAHSKKRCDSKPESPEHEYVKFLVARAALEAGWEVKTEWRGESASGEVWVADVFCTKGKARVALEIQLSPQTVSETERRQKRYRESGVRCAWFMAKTATKKDTYYQSKDVPVFMISKPIVGYIPVVENFGTELDEFVKGMLGGRIKWTEEPYIYSVSYINDTCWKCHKPNKQVVGYSIDVYGSEFQTVPHASSVLKDVSDFITNQELKGLGLNSIGKFDKFNGKHTDYPYCNTCIHCRSPQNNHHVFKKFESYSSREDAGEVEMIEFVSPREADGLWEIITSKELA
jgi:competence protein CoiA-like protein